MHAAVHSPVCNWDYVNPEIIALTGGPGTGKSTTTIALIQKLRAKGLNVLVAATTANAAQHLALYHPADTIDAIMYLQPGRTLKALMPNSQARAQLEAADVIICDESSMLTSMKLLLIKYRMRMCTKQGAKRKVLVLVGDQAQLPPICRHDIEDGHVCKYCHLMYSADWQGANRYELTAVYRQAGDRGTWSF